MSHLQFERWLLDSEGLSGEQQRALEAHLEACPRCRQMQAGMRGVEALFGTLDLPEPRPGFARRWEMRLDAYLRAERDRRYRRQVGLSLFVLLVAVVGLAVVFTLQLVGVTAAWVDVLVGALYRLFAVLSVLGAWQNLFSILWKAIGHWVPPVLWGSLFAMAGALSALWLGWLARWVTLSRRVSL